MTARHFFCHICGIYPFHRKRVTPDFLGINVFCLDDFWIRPAFPSDKPPALAMK